MTTRVLISVLVALVLSQCKDKCETVEGPRVARVKPIAWSHSMVLDMVADLRIDMDTNHSRQIEITAQEGVHELVRTTFSPLGEMTVSMDDCVKDNAEILLAMNVDTLFRITLTSAGKISSGEKLTGHKFRLTNEGLGDLDFAIQSDNIIAEIKSAGDIKLAGATKRLDFLTMASGDLRAYNLVADTVSLHMVGTSICEVYTDGVLNVRFYKGGVVNYRGNPTQINVVGEGKVNHFEL